MKCEHKNIRLNFHGVIVVRQTINAEEALVHIAC